MTAGTSPHRYAGAAGFKAHTETAHFAAWDAFAKTEPFSSEPVIFKYAAPAA